MLQEYKIFPDKVTENILERIQSYHPPMNEALLDPIIPKSRLGVKKYFCIFCKNLFTKLPLHFENKHRHEEEVHKFLILPKGKLFY